MNTKTIISIICTTVIASSVAFALGIKPNTNQKTKKTPVYEWTIPSLDARFNKDEANFLRYNDANKKIKKAPVAIFMGDSITDGWARKRPNFFKDNNYVGRGISGQVTSQMLVRFRRDVIDLKPEFVLILAGTNDVARNRGYISEENIVGNIISMCEISKANNIEPIICSILPADKYKWRPVIKSVEPIKRINDMLKKYAQENSIVFLDYYSKLDNGKGGLSKAHALDGVHPTNECYTIMEAMAKQLIDSKRR
ncbi:MAG: hypothetical protein J6B07_06100 [Opitutales bacterium]|nr:hypothetical protein [Opitutales bacterium]